MRGYGGGCARKNIRGGGGLGSILAHFIVHFIMEEKCQIEGSFYMTLLLPAEDRDG